MKYLLAFLIAFVGVKFTSICCGQAEFQRTSTSTSDAEQQPYQRRETITYAWKTNGIEVSFYRQGTNLYWTMAVGDSLGIIYETLSAGKEKVWDASDSKCSLSDGLQIIDRSLTDFHTEKPTAKLESIDVEMEIIRDLWVNVLTDLHRQLSNESGMKNSGRFDTPTEIDDAVQRTVEDSPTTAAICTLIKKHGMTVKFVDQSEHVIFKDSLTGRKWSNIAALPGCGIWMPGTVEYYIDGNQM